MTINELIKRVAEGERIEDHMDTIKRDHKWIVRFEIVDESEAEIEAYRKIYAVAKSFEAPKKSLVLADLRGLYADREKAHWDE